MIIKIKSDLSIHEIKKTIRIIVDGVVEKTKFRNISDYYWSNKNLDPFFAGIPRSSETARYLKDLKNKRQLKMLKNSKTKIAFSIYISCNNYLYNFLKIKVWSLSALKDQLTTFSEDLKRKENYYEICFRCSDKNYFGSLLKKIKKRLEEIEKWVLF